MYDLPCAQVEERMNCKSFGIIAITIYSKSLSLLVVFVVDAHLMEIKPIVRVCVYAPCLLTAVISKCQRRPFATPISLIKSFVFNTVADIMGHSNQDSWRRWNNYVVKWKWISLWHWERADGVTSTTLSSKPNAHTHTFSRTLERRTK